MSAQQALNGNGVLLRSLAIVAGLVVLVVGLLAWCGGDAVRQPGATRWSPAPNPDPSEPRWRDRIAGTIDPMKPRATGGLVYSTEGGRMCPACRQPVARCTCAATPAPRGDGIVRVSREKQGRGGKTVTVIRGLGLDAEALAAYGRKLRGACGTGGTAKDGVAEVQGDHVERVIALLQADGRIVKRAGG